MPKIDAIKIQIAGVATKLDISWSKKDRQFYVVNFPETIRQAIGRAPQKHDDFESLQKDIRSIIKEYEELITTRRRVIIVKIELATDAFDKITGTEEEFFEQGGKTSSNPMTHAACRFHGTRFYTISGYGISVNHYLGYEIGTGAKIKHTIDWPTEDMQVSHTLEGNEIVLTWTKDREDFIISFEKSILKLCEDVVQFFGGNVDGIQKAIDSGRRLLELKEKE